MEVGFCLFPGHFAAGLKGNRDYTFTTRNYAEGMAGSRAPRLDLSSPTGLLGRAGGPEETTVRSAVQVQIT